MKNKPPSAILVSLALNTALTVLEIIVGLAIGSVALIADGYKNLVDSLMLVVAFFAERLGNGKKRSIRRTKRNAAIFNIVIVLCLTLEILYNSIQRLRHPTLTHGIGVIIVAAIAVLVNLIAAATIKSKQQIASRVAYIGLLSSAASGAAVFLSGLMIATYHILWIDGVTGLFIAALLLIIVSQLTKNAMIKV